MPKNKFGGEYKEVRFKLSKFLFSALKSESIKTGLTMSQIVRSMLYDKLVRERKINDF